MKHQAMLDYLRNYPPLDRYLKLNASNNEVGDTSFNTVFGDEVVSEYTCGDQVREYTFAIVQFLDYSDGFNTINAEALNEVEDFMDWIDQQNKDGNYPDFGKNCEIYEIKNLQNMPNLAGVDEQNKAKYMFIVRIEYTERKL